MSTISLIKFKIKSGDIFGIRREFTGSLGPGYIVRSTFKDATFYTVSERLNEILVSIEGYEGRVILPSRPFVVFYLQASGLSPIQLTPNSQAYLLGFTHFAKCILGEKPSVAFFKFMFIVSTKVDFDQTYALSSVDREVKVKFKGSLSKVCDWKGNFLIV